ncbi:eukaryotic peptide chain release factor eRF1 [Ordospora colligata]|uniref:Eukaryotic peptide chain release factor eRF1 n=1 Tax=Ordospora colligata OC4 TaxID=1354746 RepID=A0A0B2UHK5_9MICR|nr:eukaryotic peptide chain release factor eRF1 [Ordospora colligata OC4]KHN70566.1 eukaryotic peptide chain release factor eRF1 [Ordospora colligata OC4]TBU17316.1 eukaryotic peptide chain release factor eRF1 [Ordospora colligata]TBU17566.1 eukaryotic peptide chain release factor eRF1 [Ordospora colligata]TBU19746.1 eukaryotic peptide chain release factor eRF1 [Ordospora colligata]
MLDEVEMWRMKKLLRNLRDSRGNGTSMISIIIPPKDQISRVSKMLTDEYGTASNIKSRVNRLSVLGAITSAQCKLKQYTKTPPNGLGIFVGTVLMDQNKEKKVSVGIEPIKPVNTSLYMCDSKFHVDDLLSLFEDELKYGFIVIDGHTTMFATLQGNVKTILQQIHVDLPKKHGRGGQSSVRFARLRVEKRHAYVKKVAEIAVNLFLTNCVMNVEGIILAGQSDLKHELAQVLDSRIGVIKSVDTNYGGEGGLNQAVELCEDVLKDVKLSKEKKVIQGFLNEINTDSGKFCFTMRETMHCLDMGAVETLIVYESLSDMKDEEMFVDWIAENYKGFGCTLVFVSDKSSEGTQFVEGFGGIGGILRYRVDVDDHLEDDYSSIDDDDIF